MSTNDRRGQRRNTCHNSLHGSRIGDPYAPQWDYALVFPRPNRVKHKFAIPVAQEIDFPSPRTVLIGYIRLSACSLRRAVGRRVKFLSRNWQLLPRSTISFYFSLNSSKDSFISAFSAKRLGLRRPNPRHPLINVRRASLVRFSRNPTFAAGLANDGSVPGPDFRGPRRQA